MIDLLDININIMRSEYQEKLIVKKYFFIIVFLIFFCYNCYDYYSFNHTNFSIMTNVLIVVDLLILVNLKI